MVSEWVPRGVELATREVLVDGVPSYLKPALLEFMRPFFCDAGYTDWFFRDSTLMEYDLVARQTPTYTQRAAQDMQWPGFFMRLSDEELLDCADWAIHRDIEAANELERILRSASSAWTIGMRNGNYGLVRRVAEAVQAEAEKAMRQGSAGALLSQAWGACYGRAADSEEAYEKAIKAVEEVAAGAVSPKNSLATLGTIVRDMKAQKDWRIDLPGQEQGVIVALAEALWTGQESRHGGNGYRRPTQLEAETAVTLAVSLVQLFSSGSAARRP